MFELLSQRGVEQVVLCHDAESGLRAIVAIHSTRLGPALGGCRFYPYGSTEEALADVLALSEAMTYKAAAAGLDLGGGKAVIIGDPKTDKTEGLLRAFGRYLHGLGGRYITAEDVGTDELDMDAIGRETCWVVGRTPAFGGSGDPSPLTAMGVMSAMRACAERAWDDPDLTGRHVAVQGVGKVGAALVGLLVAGGARVTVADVDGLAARRCADVYGVDIVEPDEIVNIDCDIVAPCAMGGAIGEFNLDTLACRIVCGSANNQLQDDAVADGLAKRSIIYAPDFVANAGGLINVAVEIEGYSRARAVGLIERIYGTTARVLADAVAADTSTVTAARAIAESRISSISRLKTIHGPAHQTGRVGRGSTPSEVGGSR